MRQRSVLARGARSRWALARALAVLGALLLTAAFQLPWVVFTLSSSQSGVRVFPGSISLSGTNFLYLLPFRAAWGQTPRALRLLQGVEWLWLGLLIGGVLLALALWQRSSTRLDRLTVRILRVWLIALTALAVLAAWVLLVADPYAGTGASLVIRGRTAGAGVWLALVALAMLWAGVYLLATEPRELERTDRRGAETGAGRHRAQAQYGALAVLLVGMLLWGVGYLALPWATVHCAAPRLSLTHYVDGTCAGVDSGDTLMAPIAPYIPSAAAPSQFASYLLLFAFMLLFGTAVLVLLGASRSTYTRGFCGWVVAWLLAATSMALLSYHGVAAVIANPPYFAGGAWHGDLGIVCTFAGLVCAWASLIPLEAAALAMGPRTLPENVRVAPQAPAPTHRPPPTPA